MRKKRVSSVNRDARRMNKKSSSNSSANQFYSSIGSYGKRKRQAKYQESTFVVDGFVFPKCTLIRSQAQLDRFFDPQTYRRKKSNSDKAQSTQKKIQSALPMGSEDSSIEEIPAKRIRTVNVEEESYEPPASRSNDESDDDVSPMIDDERSEKKNKNRKARTLPPSVSTERTIASTLHDQDIRTRVNREESVDARSESDNEKETSAFGHSDSDDASEWNTGASTMRRVASVSIKTKKADGTIIERAIPATDQEETRASRAKRRRQIGKVNQENRRRIEEEHRLRDQLTLMSENQTRIVNADNYKRIEGMLVQILSVHDIYGS